VFLIIVIILAWPVLLNESVFMRVSNKCKNLY
jgi:hypothetical protein